MGTVSYTHLLKEGRAVVVNLHKLDREFAQRTIDFLTGVVFALDGKIQKIGTNVILCSPEGIGAVSYAHLAVPGSMHMSSSWTVCSFAAGIVCC